ncbi:MAG: hypothetical protein OEY34_00305 [Cyclobacteriaceae bacterium]|nr:hypothetical protein [Cyclobacteriaceae bacterium]
MKNKNLLLIIGIAAALIIFIGQVGVYYATPVVKKVNTEQSSDQNHQDDESNEVIITPQATISTIVQVGFHSALQFISDIFHEIEVGISSFIKIDQIQEELFKTLFEKIISPNAP